MCKADLTLKDLLLISAFPYMLLGYTLLCLAYLPYALIMDGLEEDADEIRIILPEDVDVSKNIDKLDSLAKILRRKG